MVWHPPHIEVAYHSREKCLENSISPKLLGDQHSCRVAICIFLTDLAHSPHQGLDEVFVVDTIAGDKEIDGLLLS